MNDAVTACVHREYFETALNAAEPIVFQKGNNPFYDMPFRLYEIIE